MDPDKTPVPMSVSRLVDSAVDDGGSYNDGVGGWSGGTFDSATGILTLHFEPDHSPEPNCEGVHYLETTHRFQLLAD